MADASNNPIDGVCEFLARSICKDNKCKGDTPASSSLISSFQHIFSPTKIIDEDAPMDIKEFPDRYEYEIPAPGRRALDKFTVEVEQVENKKVLQFARTGEQTNWEKTEEEKDVIMYLSKERDQIKGFKASAPLPSDADIDTVTIDRNNFYGMFKVTVMKSGTGKPKQIKV